MYSPASTSSSSFVLEYADLIDGLTIGAGTGEVGVTQDEETMYIKYVMGGATFGFQRSEVDFAAAATSDTEADHYGISFAVNENLTVSYDNSSSDKATSSVDEETDSIQASYTMGNMKIKAHISKSDNEGYSSGADDETKAIDVSWSF